MGWFPYLFYSTTYVAQVMADELGREPDLDKATRAGSLALLIYSFGELSQLGELTAVAIAAGTLLPYLSSRDRRLLGPSADAKREDDMDEDEVELEHIRELVRQWKAESARQGRPLKLPSSELGCVAALSVVPFMLRNIWTAGLLLFAAIMASTFFIKTVVQVSTERW